MQVVVPIKSFTQAKKRLATVLTAQQRSELMAHMVDDVLDAIAATAEVDGITVVTGDLEVKHWVGQRALSLSKPLRVLDQPTAPSHPGELGEDGLCRAYSAAAAQLMAEGVGSMLLLPADIPLIKAADLQALISAHKCPGVTLARAGSDGGTNALLVSPPNMIAPAFGHNSCQRHIDLTREQGYEPSVLDVPALSLDVDTIDDIKSLLATGKACTTQRYLLDCGIAAFFGDEQTGGEAHGDKVDEPLQSAKRRQHFQQNQKQINKTQQNQTSRQVG